MKEHVLQVKVANEDDFKLLAPESEFVNPIPPEENPIPSLSVLQLVLLTLNQEVIIPAFPPERATRTHRHTKTDTHYVERLEEYPVPDDIQKSIDAIHR